MTGIPLNEDTPKIATHDLSSDWEPPPGYCPKGGQALTGWIMGWAAQYTFSMVKPALDDDGARNAITAMLAAQMG